MKCFGGGGKNEVEFQEDEASFEPRPTITRNPFAWRTKPKDVVPANAFYSRLMPSLQTGDLVFFSSPNFPRVHELLKCRWDHVGMVYKPDGVELRQGDNKKKGGEKGEVLIVEATHGNVPGKRHEGERLSGVDMASLEDRIRFFLSEDTEDGTKRFVGVRRYEGPKFTQEQLRGLETSYLKYKDTPFEKDLNSILRAAVDVEGDKKFKAEDDDSEVFDSEFVASIYQMMGLLPSPKKGGVIPAEWTVADFSYDMNSDDFVLTNDGWYKKPIVISSETNVEAGLSAFDLTEAMIQEAEDVRGTNAPNLKVALAFAKQTVMSSVVKHLFFSVVMWLLVVKSLWILYAPLSMGYFNAIFCAVEQSRLNPTRKAEPIIWRNVWVFMSPRHITLEVVIASVAHVGLFFVALWIAIPTCGLGFFYFLARNMYMVPLLVFKRDGSAHWENCRRRSFLMTGRFNTKGHVLLFVIMTATAIVPFLFTFSLSIWASAYMQVFHENLGVEDEFVYANGKPLTAEEARQKKVLHWQFEKRKDGGGGKKGDKFVELEEQ